MHHITPLFSIYTNHVNQLVTGGRNEGVVEGKKGGGGGEVETGENAQQGASILTT